MFLGIGFMWWVIIIVILAVSIPIKLKFLKWYSEKANQKKKDKWGDE